MSLVDRNDCVCGRLSNPHIDESTNPRIHDGVKDSKDQSLMLKGSF